MASIKAQSPVQAQDDDPVVSKAAIGTSLIVQSGAISTAMVLPVCLKARMARAIAA
jgi:hypothetical protein